MDEILLLFPAADAGETLTPDDRAIVPALAPERRREAATLIVWYRNHPATYTAFVGESYRLLAERGPGIAPLHVANSIRHPVRGIAPVEMGNGEATFLARIAKAKEPGLSRAFNLKDAPLADAIMATGWTP